MKMSAAVKHLVVDPFCFRQFELGSGKTPYVPISVEAFEQKVNEVFSTEKLVDGYAPFCKHLFLDNFVGCDSNALAITPENEHLLKTGYVARTEYELAVLSRWFPKENVEAKEAKYIDLILYSRDQINKENAATGQPSQDETAPWGIVGIKAQDVDYELPMSPITMMRNSLGKEQGGSGVPLDAEKYRESVEYWSRYAPIQ